MKNNKCKNFSDFVDLVCDQYIFFEKTSEDFIGVSVVAHYEVMIDFLNELVKNTDFGIININPGSISIPKGGTAAGFGVIDNDQISLYELNGTKIKEFKLW